MQQAKRNFICCRILFSHFQYLPTVIMEQGIVWKSVDVVFAFLYSYKSKVLLKFAFLQTKLICSPTKYKIRN